ncbi:MAG: carboxylating nicotinate-nucleotide diphosphorylase [Planctomycetes bacterium]|nr:carboxylating nicotinate-nucleotide diphosphorylase [Planctomycetota bacterium]
MTLGDHDDIRRLIELAKDEDLGTGDLTSALTIDSHEASAFRVVAKQTGVFAGREIAPAVVRAYDPSIEITWTDAGRDGARIESIPTELATIRGPLAQVLAAERAVLNFLQRLSGVATLTRTYVDAVAGTTATICDTRKTTPGWRQLDKYAVRCGGGTNHRFGLYDAVLIKDNHLTGIEPSRMASAVFDMLNRLDRSRVKPTFIEVEAQTLAQVEELCKVVGIDVILVDNSSLDQLRQAVAIRNANALEGTVQLEASGGITLGTVRAVAETGVERISIGALTHSAPALDLSLERVEC